MTNYEQALNFFSVRYNTMDGLIIDLHRIKVCSSLLKSMFGMINYVPVTGRKNVGIAVEAR